MNRYASNRRKPSREDGVTFRLKEDELLELVQRADRLGLSRHMLGREYVTQALAVEDDRSDLIAMMNALANAIHELRLDLAFGVEALLVASGQYSAEEAHTWVQSQFKVP